MDSGDDTNSLSDNHKESDQDSDSGLDTASRASDPDPCHTKEVDPLFFSIENEERDDTNNDQVLELPPELTNDSDLARGHLSHDLDPEFQDNTDLTDIRVDDLLNKNDLDLNNEEKLDLTENGPQNSTELDTKSDPELESTSDLTNDNENDLVKSDLVHDLELEDKPDRTDTYDPDLINKEDTDLSNKIDPDLVNKKDPNLTNKDTYYLANRRDNDNDIELNPDKLNVHLEPKPSAGGNEVPKKQKHLKASVPGTKPPKKQQGTKKESKWAIVRRHFLGKKKKTRSASKNNGLETHVDLRSIPISLNENDRGFNDKLNISSIVNAFKSNHISLNNFSGKSMKCKNDDNWKDQLKKQEEALKAYTTVYDVYSGRMFNYHDLQEMRKPQPYYPPPEAIQARRKRKRGCVIS